MNAKITFVELVELMVEATSTSKRLCDLFLRELFATVSQALIDGESVKVKGIGTFKVTDVKSRKSVDISTGHEVQISGYRKVSFTPDKSLAEAVNQPFAQFESVILDDAVTDEELAAIDRKYPSNLSPSPINSQSEESAAAEPPVKTETIKEVPPVEKDAGSLAPGGGDYPELEELFPNSEPDEFFVPEPLGYTLPFMEGAIDQPDTPAPSQEPVKEQPAKQDNPPAAAPEPQDNFYRPEPRNAYTPTAQQLAKRRKSLKLRPWLFVVALAAVGLLSWLSWLLLRGSGNGSDASSGLAMNDSSEMVVEAAPAVITDTVTSKIVLSTLSDRYYDSPWFWVYIYEENKDIISDPNNVRPGTIVVIPPAEKYDIDASDPASLKKAQLLSWKILKGK